MVFSTVVKKTAADEARPTQVAILDQAGKFASYDLENDTAELDWLLGRHSDGLKPGDRVGMVLGGSGDRFSAALSRRGEEIGAQVFRLPPFVLKEQRGDTEKDDDHATLAALLQKQPEIFYLMRQRDRDTIRVKTALQLRTDAVKARIGCEQRIRQSFIGSVFLNEEGRYPEGEIEMLAQLELANDSILQCLLKDEKRRQKELEDAVKATPIWEAIFAPFEGCGPRLAAPFIAYISDIRRFWVEPGPKARQKGMAKLKKFCGVHVLTVDKNGGLIPKNRQFPRRRVGTVANWNPQVRQALYLLGEQFNRRPNSEWGKKLIEYKLKLRQAHPEVIEENGKKRYTNGHIHKMALWRTLTKFVEYLSKEWTRFELEQQRRERDSVVA